MPTVDETMKALEQAETSNAQEAEASIRRNVRILRRAGVQGLPATLDIPGYFTKWLVQAVEINASLLTPVPMGFQQQCTHTSQKSNTNQFGLTIRCSNPNCKLLLLKGEVMGPIMITGKTAQKKLMVYNQARQEMIADPQESVRRAGRAAQAEADKFPHLKNVMCVQKALVMNTPPLDMAAIEGAVERPLATIAHLMHESNSTTQQALQVIIQGNQAAQQQSTTQAQGLRDLLVQSHQDSTEAQRQLIVQLGTHIGQEIQAGMAQQTEMMRRVLRQEGQPLALAEGVRPTVAEPPPPGVALQQALTPQWGRQPQLPPQTTGPQAFAMGEVGGNWVELNASPPDNNP